MRREAFEVIESARALQVQLAPTQPNPRCVRIGGDRADFPNRLWRLARAIEAFDKVGEAALGDVGNAPSSDPTADAARLKVALDGVFRWMRSTGIDVSEPYGLVTEALGVPMPAEKAARGYRPIPTFAPNGFRKPIRTRPMLRLEPGVGEQISLGVLAQKEMQAQMVENSMGAAAPVSRGARA